MPPTIALLTDFGLQDTYVGVMKGVMLRICPTAQLIDLTHAIQPQAIKQGALALLDSFAYFPLGTTFLVVVDPGVGSERRSIAVRVRSGAYTFVGPDNGVLSYVMRQFTGWEAFELTKKQYWLPETSHTFHGRDIFAPVAAHIANGVSPAQLGQPINDPVVLPPPRLNILEKRIIGEVIDIDTYGTLVTSIGSLAHIGTSDILTLSPRFGREGTLQRFSARKVRIRTAGGNSIRTIQRAFADVEPGDLVALIGSRGFLEIAVNQGSAAQRLGMAIGDPVEVLTGEG